jgi:DNA-binding MarR family transcriptional regulator
MSTLEERWGAGTIRLGFTGVPNLLLRVNALKETKGSERITAAEMFVLLVILEHWINHRRQPFPSIERIARHTGLSNRHVRRIVKALATKSYLTSHRHGELDGRRNSYSLRPIVDRLSKAADRLHAAINFALVEESVTRLEIADRLGLFSRNPEDPNADPD